MRSIVSIITALAVNLHLVLGCCSHHAHSETAVAINHDHALVPSHSHHGSHHHHDSSPHEPAVPWFPPHDDCHESHCAYMTAGAVSFVPEVAVAFILPIIDPPASAMVQSRGVDPRDRGDPGNLAVPFYLRHLAFLS